MKVAILSIGDYKHITMIAKYTAYFDAHQVPYDIICADRYGDVYPDKPNLIRYAFRGESKAEKLMAFLRFRKWAKQVIRENQYDFIIVWNENTALLFCDLLLGRYRNRYCVNIRDVDFLNQKLANVIRGWVIRGSKFSTYCSTHKLDFPKGYQYVLMRSVNTEILNDVPERTALVEEGKPIRIVFLGKVRFFDAIDDMIRAFGNDPRYELWFIGAGSERLAHYREEYTNVFLRGAYKPEETAGFLRDTDVINSYFGTKVLGYERMSSIRFSYAPYMNIPVIVGTKTNMEEEGSRYGFAYGFGQTEISREADRFYAWYRGLDMPAFCRGCAQYRHDVQETDRKFYEILQTLFVEQK